MLVKKHQGKASPVNQWLRIHLPIQGAQVQSVVREIRSSMFWGVAAWKIPWMEEPGGLQSMGSLRVGHN